MLYMLKFAAVAAYHETNGNDHGCREGICEHLES